MSRLYSFGISTLFTRFISPFLSPKWLVIIVSVGVLSGTASAVFLAVLEWVTHFRNSHIWLLALLPIGGLGIGLLYYYWGKDVVGGNNQILVEYDHPQKVIPFRMAPFVLIGTWLTHLLGGSAGREGTAVQMGAAISDQFTKIFKLNTQQRKVLLIMGISGGFASVFGTPWAGAVFSIEILNQGVKRYQAVLPTILTAFIADFVCSAWGVGHTHFHVFEIPSHHVITLLYSVLAGILFGGAALLFIRSHHLFAKVFQYTFSWPPLRPLVGGGLLAVVFWLTDTQRFMGLGVPIIESSFVETLAPTDFLLKLLFTTFTLAAGFKGGEVTPLFFIGAALGNALFAWLPLPLSLLAGIGMVAVFAGATNTPIASTVMGMELFGYELGVFLALACWAAYFASGNSSIYASQKAGGLKNKLYQKLHSGILYLRKKVR